MTLRDTFNSLASANGHNTPAEMIQQDTSKLSDQFLADARNLRKDLDEGLSKVDAIEDVAVRSMALLKLRETLGLNKCSGC